MAAIPALRALPLAVLLFACGTFESPGPGPRSGAAPPTRAALAVPRLAIHPTPELDVVESRLGDLTAVIRRSPWRLRVVAPEGALTWEEAEAARSGESGPLGFRLHDQTWHRLTRVLDARQDGGEVKLRVATDDPSGREASVTLQPIGPRQVRLRVSLSEPGGVAAIGQAVLSPPDERLLGFGERFTGVNQRGRVVTHWAEDRRMAGYGESTYAPIPYFISSRGYSLALETDARAVFDLAASRPDRYAWEVPAGEASVVFAYGPNPRDLIRRQAELMGLPPLPPIWAFGVWKTAIGGEPTVLRDAARLRELGVPVSALYVYDTVDAQAKIGWGETIFHTRPVGVYRDLRALTDQLRSRGFKALTYFNPHFDLGWPGYADAARRGFFVRRPDGRPHVHPTFNFSWLDVTNPRAIGWWGGMWERALVDLGFDGGMVDYGDMTPTDGRYADGQDGPVTHNRYPRLYAKAAMEAARRHQPDAVLFSRSGTAGSPAFQHLLWPGDPLVDWSEVAGFKSMLPAALNAGLSGFPFWHPEVGGFVGTDLPTESERELWLRWLQLGAFSPLLRDEYGDRPPGRTPIEMWTDDETIEAYRFYARLHSRLVPYLYSYARIASETGLPLMRHLALGFPDDPRAWAEERSYLLGDEILVAPVVDEGARSRPVYLPAGLWVDFWTNDLIVGGREIVADAPLDRIPVFLRAGAILPLATEFDTLVPSEDPAVRAWSGDLIIRVTPSRGEAAHRFRLYDGTELTYQTDGARSLFKVQGAPTSSGFEIRLPARAAPTSVLVNGAPFADWRFDAEAGEAVVSVQAGDIQIEMR